MSSVRDLACKAPGSSKSILPGFEFDSLTGCDGGRTLSL